MELKIASDVFQEAMSELFADMKNIVVCIDDILIIGARTFEEHLPTIEEVLKRLNEKGMRVNTGKGAWAMPEAEYLIFNYLARYQASTEKDSRYFRYERIQKHETSEEFRRHGELL